MPSDQFQAELPGELFGLAVQPGDDPLGIECQHTVRVVFKQRHIVLFCLYDSAVLALLPGVSVGIRNDIQATANKQR
ncbi:hypothetical protein D3C74_371330 [compost metagenome]